MEQSLIDFECIIVDDGSTDDSVELINSFIEKDNRIKLIKQEHAGVAVARNKGMRLSKGQYLIFLDSDDVLNISYLEEANKNINNYPDFFLYYTGAEFIGSKSGEWVLPKYDYKELLLGCNMIYLTTVIRREDALKIGGFSELMTEGWEDWEMYIRLLYEVKPERIIKNKHSLFYYRIKAHSRSVNINLSPEKRTRMMNVCFMINSHIYLHYFPNFIESLSSFEYYKNLSTTKLFKIYFKLKLMLNQ
jgi:glycosyltransferase involved in cell wall biosynthesis